MIDTKRISIALSEDIDIASGNITGQRSEAGPDGTLNMVVTVNYKRKPKEPVKPEVVRYRLYVDLTEHGVWSPLKVVTSTDWSEVENVLRAVAAGYAEFRTSWVAIGLGAERFNFPGVADNDRHTT